MHRRFHDQFNIASDSLLVAQIASALSNLKILLPDQFNASLLDESAEKKRRKRRKKKNKKQNYSSSSSPPPPLFCPTEIQ